MCIHVLLDLSFSLSFSLSLSLPLSRLKHSPGLVHSSCWLRVTPSLTSFVLLSVSSRLVRSSWSSSSTRRVSWWALDGCSDRGTPTTTGQSTSSRKGNLISLLSLFYCQSYFRVHQIPTDVVFCLQKIILLKVFVGYNFPRPGFFCINCQIIF